MFERTKPSRVEVENLKAQWRADGTWDIEDTPGFEDHYDELLAHRKEFEAKQERERIGRLKLKAVELGCPDNLELARYIERLESRIKDLENTYWAEHP